MAEKLIGRLTAEFGLNPRTLRCYEALRLLPSPSRTNGGYRVYGEEEVRRLLFTNGHLGKTLYVSYWVVILATATIAIGTGIPVSTTHTIFGAIIGVGATRRLSAVRWGVATRIVWAWIITIPASALFAAITYTALRTLGK
jgi:phosphate/sulfate permease